MVPCPLLFSCLCSKVTVYRWKWQWVFLDILSSSTRAPDIRVHRAGSQLKTIAIFNHKQRHLSIGMKTKVVQHVPRINISIWNVTCDSMTNSHFWAYTWKQKLFSISHGSLTWLKWDIWHTTAWQTHTLELKHENKLFSMWLTWITWIKWLM